MDSFAGSAKSGARGMKVRLTRSQSTKLFGGCAIRVVLAAMPQFGPQHVRYRRSEPDHHEWNVG